MFATDIKRYTKVSEGVTCRGASDFFLSFFLFYLNLLDSYFGSPFHGCNLPFNGLSFYGEAPQLFVPPTNSLAPLLGADASSVFTQHQRKRGAVESRCLACHKYFVNLNPMRTFTQASPCKNSKQGEPRRVKQTLAMTCGKTCKQWALVPS